MKALTATQVECALLMKNMPMLVITGPTYTSYRVGNRTFHSSTFEALERHGKLEKVYAEVDSPFITELYKLKKS